MARHARLRLAGCPLHVVQRGNNKSQCFHRESDYLCYLHLLREHAEKFGCAVHAYVLMTNHVHLLLTPEAADGASLLMKHLGQRYVQYVNRTQARSGTLWEGRFRSSIVDRENYLLACYRYIEMNPVRACMVERPADYRWSSYRVNALGAASKLITPHAEYLALAEGILARQLAYRGLFEQPIADRCLQEIRGAARGGYVLGRRGFKAGVAAVLARPVERRSAGRPRTASLPSDC